MTLAADVPIVGPAVRGIKENVDLMGFLAIWVRHYFVHRCTIRTVII